MDDYLVLFGQIVVRNPKCLRILNVNIQDYPQKNVPDFNIDHQRVCVI